MVGASRTFAWTIVLALVATFPGSLALGAAPEADAPGVPSPSGPYGLDAFRAAWSLDAGIGLRAGGGQGKTTTTLSQETVCALGDVDGDGMADLLVRIPVGNKGKYRYEAYAGPDLDRLLWKSNDETASRMSCASDATGDGAADPILSAEPETAPGPVPDAPASQSATQSIEVDVLDGATGAINLEVPLDSDNTTIGSEDVLVDAGTATAIAPAGEGAYLVVEEQTIQVDLPDLLDPLQPAQTQATVDIVDAMGEVIGTIDSTPSGQDIAVAARPDASGNVEDLEILVLTTAEAPPIEGSPASLPSVILYEEDGSEIWSVPQDVTTGAVVVIPDIGDFDGDGVSDLIYITVQDPSSLVADGLYHVLSGANGDILLESGAGTTSFLTALAFGDVDGDGKVEVLVVRQDEPGGTVSISPVGRDGGPLWTIQAQADVLPVNLVADPGTGNFVSHSDVTGDGLPDVVLSRPTEDGLNVTTYDGATGEVVWEEDFQGADQADAIDAGDGTEVLVVVDLDDGLTVTQVDGSDGSVQWQDQGAGGSSTAVSVQDAGDVDGDGVRDIIVSTGRAVDTAPVAGSTPAVDTNRPVSTIVISGASGSTLRSMDQGMAPVVLTQPEDGGVLGIPGVGPLVLLGELAALAAVARRRA